MTHPITTTKESTMTTDHTGTGHDAAPATSPMDPIGIPPEAVRLNPGYRAAHIGPPPGISDDDCGTPEVLIGQTPEGFPVLADYWRPTPEQLAMLNTGGFIELRQYSPRMVMHSLTIYSQTSDAGSICGRTYETFAVCHKPEGHEGKCWE